MDRLSLKNTRSKFEISGELLIILEESVEYTSIEESKTGRCQHVTGWIKKHEDLHRKLPGKLKRNQSFVLACWPPVSFNLFFALILCLSGSPGGKCSKTRVDTIRNPPEIDKYS